MPRLRRSRTTEPGLRRVRRGRGFAYLDESGAAITDEATRERISDLAIPPAWNDVWISPHPHGHIQATGVDDAGRRQYLYHQVWRERQDRVKFERMLALAETLPGARRTVTLDLRSDGLGRSRVLATAFRMLDTGSLRVGSERYADVHGSYGLCTLLCAHASVHDGERVELRFPGKSGQPWESELTDPDLAAVVRALKRRGGRARLLAWRDGDGEVHPLHPEEINADIRRRTGGDFTAKDFRTLHGTAAAALSLAKAGPVESPSRRARMVAAAMRDAAFVLGNTPAIARSSYVDPRIVEAYEHGTTIDPSRPASVESELRAMLR